MKIAEGAACRKAAKCVRQSEGEMGCAPCVCVHAQTDL